MKENPMKTSNFSERSFLINMIDEFAKCEALRAEQGLLLKMAERFRNRLVREEIAETLALYRRTESSLKVSLLQAIKNDHWNDSQRLSAEISEVVEKRQAMETQLKALANEGL